MRFPIPRSLRAFPLMLVFLASGSAAQHQLEGFWSGQWIDGEPGHLQITQTPSGLQFAFMGHAMSLSGNVLIIRTVQRMDPECGPVTVTEGAFHVQPGGDLLLFEISSCDPDFLYFTDVHGNPTEFGFRRA